MPGTERTRQEKTSVLQTQECREDQRMIDKKRGELTLIHTRILAGVCLEALLLLSGCHHQETPAAAPSAGDVSEFDSAVRDGDTSIVSRLIKAKPEMINAKDEQGKTPLKIATEKGDQEMADLLRRHGGHE